MKEIYNLTEEQLDIKNDMIETANRLGYCFMSAKNRGFGKTNIIRDIGLEYQALGYKVYIFKDIYGEQEYIANEILTAGERYRGVSFPKKSIVLVDEAYLNDLGWVLKQCVNQNILCMGFVKFRNSRGKCGGVLFHDILAFTKN